MSEQFDKRSETSSPMNRREIEDARAHLKAWFPNQSVERHTFNKLCDQAVRSLKNAAPQGSVEIAGTPVAAPEAPAAAASFGDGDSLSDKHDETVRGFLSALAAGRCYACGWPLAAKVEDGCMPFNCSMRYKDGTEHIAEREQWRRRAEAAAALATWARLGERMQPEAARIHADDAAFLAWFERTRPATLMQWWEMFKKETAVSPQRFKKEKPT